MLEVCKVDGCDRPIYCKGLCNRCYQRLKRRKKLRQRQEPLCAPGEEWREIKGWEGFYAISNFGRVKSLRREITHEKGIHQGARYCFDEKILKPRFAGKGYLTVPLSRKNHPIAAYIHRLVAEAFLLNPDNKPIVNHKDGNKQNNRADNLEWVTQAENCQHSYYALRNTGGTFKAVSIKCVETGESFKSTAEAARKKKLDRRTLCYALNVGKKYGGYHWVRG